jgi:hypothetical protein
MFSSLGQAWGPALFPGVFPKIIAVFLREGKCLLLTLFPLKLKLFSPEAKGDLLMAEKTIVFSDQEQMQAEAIVIDKDGEEALRYLANLLERLKGHPGHACGPKASG